MDFEIYHPLHKYSVYRHGKWQCHITNEGYVCSSRHCSYQTLQPLYADKTTLTPFTPSNPTDCCPYCGSTLNININLKHDEDTTMTQAVDLPQPHKTRYKKFLTQELKKHNVFTQDRFNGLVQYHEFN